MNIGPYEVVDPIADKLGESGMGVVYKAVQRSLRRTVAIKVPKDDCLRDPSLVERFKREAESAANMQDPNIVTVYEACLHEPPYFYAMEFLSGGTLKQYVDKAHPSPAELLPAFKALCHGLDSAHRRGIVHRDIKPDNLMADERGHWKITDFGIAKDLEGTSAGTSTGAQFGTIPYMSPEQIEDSSKVDWRSDIYSAGATVYHALAGKPAFEGGIVTIMRNVVQGKFEPLAAVRPDLKHLDGIVRKAMAMRPEDRYQSCGDLYSDLEKAIGSGKAVVAAPVARAAVAQPFEVEPARQPSARRFPLVPVVMTVLALLLIAAAVAGVMNQGQPPNSGTGATESDPYTGIDLSGLGAAPSQTAQEAANSDTLGAKGSKRTPPAKHQPDAISDSKRGINNGPRGPNSTTNNGVGGSRKPRPGSAAAASTDKSIVGEYLEGKGMPDFGTHGSSHSVADGAPGKQVGPNPPAADALENGRKNSTRPENESDSKDRNENASEKNKSTQSKDGPSGRTY